MVIGGQKKLQKASEYIHYLDNFKGMKSLFIR